VRGWRLLTKWDTRRFKKLCSDGHLFSEDYRIYKDWSGIDKLRERYIQIKDGLVLEGEVQEMNNEEIFFDKEPYK
jgi:hypothetical protein